MLNSTSINRPALGVILFAAEAQLASCDQALAGCRGDATT